MFETKRNQMNTLRSWKIVVYNIASETVLLLPKTFKSFLPVIWDMLPMYYFGFYLNVALAENSSMKIRGKSSARVEWMDAVHINASFSAVNPRRDDSC